MPIREATEQDAPRIVEMGSRSLREGPYSDEIDNPEQSLKTALEVMRSESGKILVAEFGGKLIGLLGFVLYPHYFTGQMTAIELMWWVEPEQRASWTAIMLLRAAQRMAKSMGATKMQFSAPTEEVGKAYESLGYKKLEVAYQRTL
jgi:hypothetical protein